MKALTSLIAIARDSSASRDHAPSSRFALESQIEAPPPDFRDAINMLRMEIGRLRACANQPSWASLRKRTLERCENAAAAATFLEGHL